MKILTEIELKFIVPRRARGKLAAEMARASSTRERVSLAAVYLDTADRRLALQGLAWRLRREGRQWVQTLKSGGANPLERFEHEVVRPGAIQDASEHAGTPLGDRLISLLKRARADGLEAGARFRTEVRRTTRKVRTRGAVVEIAFDEGRLLAGELTRPILEIEFELLSGSAAGLLGLAERWRQRFGLIYDPRSKAERGDRLAEGSPFPPVRKAMLPVYAKGATAIEAFGFVLDECLAQITHNSVGLIDGDPALRADHVHQLRVGIRRLRSTLRSFQGWVPSPPAHLVQSLRSLFAALGVARDDDVLGSGVVSELARVGAPPLALSISATVVNPVRTVTDSEVQRLFLAWISWRVGLTPAAKSEGKASVPDSGAAPANADAAATAADDLSAKNGASDAEHDLPQLRVRVECRILRWHRRIVEDWNGFDHLDEEALHSLRKRIKRQRYAVEFFTPMLRRRQVERYLEAVAGVQDRLGALNDLFVARARYQALVAADPSAWFALGWLAARISELRALTKPELERLAKLAPPSSRD